MWFDLPANTREQRSNWYVLHLHYRVVLAQPFVLGRETIIGAATNKVGCAYIRFKPLSQSTIDPAEDGTLHGVTHRKVEATTVTGWFENYLAAAGVHGAIALQNGETAISEPRVNEVRSVRGSCGR
jgi:hypothetical protein